MATIVTRAGKGSPLTNAEVDANFTNLNNQLATALFGANNLSDLANVSTARSNLGLAIGSNVQAWDVHLDQIAALVPTLDNFIVGDGASWTLETPAQARSSLGVVIGTNVQAWDGDLDAIAALAGTSGFLKKTAANTWALDTSTYLTGNQTITATGDATGSGATSIALTLAASGVTAGTYTKVTVDAKGRVTTGASLASADLPTYTGTITSSQVTTGLGFTPYNSSNPSGYITSSSLSSYLPLAGGTLTGALTLNGGDLKAYRAGGTTGALFLNSAGTSYLYWDGTNYNLNAGNLNVGGNIAATGNVTAYSDESLKTDWQPLPDDFIEMLANLKHGSYLRIDSNERQVGVSAQGLRSFMPEAVIGSEILSVAYGNAALVSAVRLAQDHLALKDRLDKLEQKVLA